MDELTIRSGEVEEDGPRWRRTLVAEPGGARVGTVTVQASRWHAQRLWIDLEVAPGERRRGAGSALLAAARELSAADGRPLRAKVLAGSDGARFAGGHGFHLLQRCRTFRLAPAPGGAAVRRDLVVDGRPDLDRVAAAFRDFYVRGHRWDPAGDMSAADLRGTHVEEAAAAVLVLDRDGAALAVGCLYAEARGLLLSGGPTMPGGGRARDASAALLDASLAHAASYGGALCVEADEYPSEMVEELELRGAAVLDEVHIVAEH